MSFPVVIEHCWPCQCVAMASSWWVHTLRPGQNGRHFPDDRSKCIFLNENIWILIIVSLKFVPKGRISNIPALVKIGDKPLSEPMIVGLLTHICVTWPQWVNGWCIQWWHPVIPLSYLDCAIYNTFHEMQHVAQSPISISKWRYQLHKDT